MPLLNPYLDFFQGLPASFRRDPWVAPSVAAQLQNPDWLTFTAAICRQFAWAVPTDEAIALIGKYSPGGVVEVAAGSGYWAWLMRQAGIDVAAFDLDPPAFTWSGIDRRDHSAVSDYPDKTLLLCWPPWATGVAAEALAAFKGEHVVYIGEWMGCNAEPNFFAWLAWYFECIDGAAIPQWYMRDDRVFVFRRRQQPTS
jgi:hypothetical protein